MTVSLNNELFKNRMEGQTGMARN